jgi:hypothetical protein
MLGGIPKSRAGRVDDATFESKITGTGARKLVPGPSTKD